MKLLLSYKLLPDVNIGDYIQVIAAKRFLSKDCIVGTVDRDRLKQYDGENGKLMLNCWYGAEPSSFPPSEKIQPMFRSFHLNKTIAKELLARSDAVNFFKTHEPIGCRDKYTVKMLQSSGVNAYFSSCLTTTIGLHLEPVKERGGIYFVDPISTYPSLNFAKRGVEQLSSLIHGLFNFSAVKKIQYSASSDSPSSILSFGNKLRWFLYAARTHHIYKQLLPSVPIDKVTFLTHLFSNTDISSEEERFILAERYLKYYRNAELVVTSRIHCALPCLGFETPVLFLEQEDDAEASKCRKDGLLQLLNVIPMNLSKVSLTLTEIEKITKKKNKNDFRSFAETLFAETKNFFAF